MIVAPRWWPHLHASHDVHQPTNSRASGTVPIEELGHLNIVLSTFARLGHSAGPNVRTGDSGA